MGLRLGYCQHGGEKEGKGREGMKGEVCSDENGWVSDVEHHGEVIRLLIMQGKCIVGWGSRTFRVCSYREEEI